MTRFLKRQTIRRGTVIFVNLIRSYYRNVMLIAIGYLYVPSNAYFVDICGKTVRLVLFPFCPPPVRRVYKNAAFEFLNVVPDESI